MPEVKWVHKGGFWASEIAKHAKEAVPVLTLDQIEEWLKTEVQRNESSLTCIGLKHLLAQVQAWKGETKKRNPRDTCHCLDEGGVVHYCDQ